ncbi:MAG: carnitine dehydratase [Rhizobiales bacterium 68-8]|nr:MAG: carnitine dehydratase [Rhizobiales bacterium 68-8]
MGRRSGPLAQLRVVEMVGVGPGPFAAMWLADMGADVVRIDRPGQRWNQTRRDVLNRSRRSVALDLKQPAGIEAALRLIDRADVLIEGYRPGVMERLGLGPEACTARNPRLVYGRMTGWGQDGPRAAEAGHDINYIATGGVLATIGTAEGGPVPPLNLIGDFGGGGMLLIAGLLAALVERGTSGRGQVVDAAMAEGASLLASMIWAYHGKGLWNGQRESNLFDGGAPFYRCYRCRDGGWVALGAIEPEFWATFLERCGIAEPLLSDNQRNRQMWPQLRARLAEIFLTRDRDEWCAMAAGSDACLTPVLSFDEAVGEGQAAARGGFVEIEGMAQPAPAPRFSRTPGAVSAPPALVGEHSREVLAEAGYGADEIARMEADGVTSVPGDAPAAGDRGPLG